MAPSSDQRTDDPPCWPKWPALSRDGLLMLAYRHGGFSTHPYGDEVGGWSGARRRKAVREANAWMLARLDLAGPPSVDEPSVPA